MGGRDPGSFVTAWRGGFPLDSDRLRGSCEEDPGDLDEDDLDEDGLGDAGLDVSDFAEWRAPLALEAAPSSDNSAPDPACRIRFCFSRLISIREAFLARAPMRLRAAGFSDGSSLADSLTVSIRFFSEGGVSVMESFRRA